MIIHNQIRQEILDVLANGGLKKIKFFHNGKTVFKDLEQELPAISVFIDETESNAFTVCEDEWIGDLQIAIYLPLHSNESELDEIAEQISFIMKDCDLETVSDCRLSRYSYDYDANESAWITATLHYSINYFS
ncbi:phage minor tail U family protein [Actinobacillus pleuropneumoniae]|uniref:phage minor tail U family protein n=1 Tax=Actinobacillus pleuropneumoniae TaxID=715 RepID=UPI001F3B823D|nr:phage minor tail U family protein [Actinobacillus pleuropneumoniae]UKH38926.1 phage tail protein [Actinobacillus pleuropneumoniae]UQZ26446.1 phage minor tail U family protein [Actinobacillus pleuropneumoniae]